MTRLGFNSDVNLGCPYTGRWQLRAKPSKKSPGWSKKSLFRDIKTETKAQRKFVDAQGHFYLIASNWSALCLLRSTVWNAWNSLPFSIFL